MRNHWVPLVAVLLASSPRMGMAAGTASGSAHGEENATETVSFLRGVGSTAVSAEYFLKLGDIVGDAQSATHRGEVGVLGYEYDVEAALERVGSDKSVTPGAVSVNPLYITKAADSASPKLRLALTSRQMFATATLCGAAASGGRQDFLRYTLTDVYLVSIRGWTTDTGLPLEKIGLVFRDLKIEPLGPTPGGASQPGNLPGPGGPTPGGDKPLPGASDQTGKAPEDAPATRVDDGAAVRLGTWVYPGGQKNAIDVLAVKPATTWFDETALADKMRVLRVQVAVRNDTGAAWRSFNESTAAMTLLDADGQTVSQETRMYYPATGQRGGGYELQKDQRLVFAYDVAYPATAHPATLVLKAWDVSLRYAVPGGG